MVGANPDGTRMGGGFVLHAMRRHKFQGRILPVNPRYPEIDGLQCFNDLASVEGDVDLAVFAVPAAALRASIDAVPMGKVKSALVLSSGFSEVGEEGAKLERELVDAARAKNIRMVGPNSVGLVNLGNGLVATISQAFDRTDFPKGDVALVSQSGAFGTALVARGQQEGLGFRYFISTGNEADLQFTDLARSLIVRDDVRVLCGYLENVRDGAGFVELAQLAASLRKPIVVLKAGVTEAGSVAAKSHTGALVGSDEVAQAVFDAYGVIRATDGEHLLELLKMFERAPRAKGKRLAIVSHSGGAGVLAADAAENAGASLPLPPDGVKAELKEKLAAYATVSNPLDMTGAASLQANLMASCLRTMLESDAYDAGVLCVALIWREGEKLLSELNALAEQGAKPFAVSWSAPSDALAPHLRTASFPVVADPARAAAALARKLVHESAAPPRPSQRKPGARVTAREFSTMSGQTAVLERYGIALPRQIIATSLEEAEAFRAELGAPVVVKIAAPELLHRTEAGGVAVNVGSAPQLARAYERIFASITEHHPNTRIDGMLIQEMAGDGVQAFVGMKRDPAFGPIVAAGAGGTLVELFGKLAMRPAPIDPDHALAMLDRSPVGKLLGGFRGAKAFDRRALAQLISNVSYLALDAPELAEMEFNPVIVLADGSGCVAVDYKFQTP
ncbi:MAG: acetate--CoA ligase family protein [Vulcanimicrobiaceae bacterium]